jgi:hypothetical protein
MTSHKLCMLRQGLHPFVPTSRCFHCEAGTPDYSKSSLTPLPHILTPYWNHTCCVLQVLAARGLQAELWAELGLKVPSQKRLDTIGSSLRAAMTEADSTFTHLLRLNPSGVPIIRRYATFLAEVRLYRRGGVPWGWGRTDRSLTGVDFLLALTSQSVSFMRAQGVQN